jgi:hypothetical protein
LVGRQEGKVRGGCIRTTIDRKKAKASRQAGRQEGGKKERKKERKVGK